MDTNTCRRGPRGLPNLRKGPWIRTPGRSGGFTPKGRGVGEFTLDGTPCSWPSLVGEVTDAGGPCVTNWACDTCRANARKGMTKIGRDICHLLLNCPFSYLLMITLRPLASH